MTRFPPPDEHAELVLVTSDGPVAARHWKSHGRLAVVWVGGVGGGWDTPARLLYPTLAARLAASGVDSLRIRFRLPGHLDECVADVLAGIRHLEATGTATAALVGHSFGGAVMIRTAAQVTSVRTVVAIATMAAGAEVADRLGPRCSLLLLHGTADPVLSHEQSEQVAQLAREPKRLVLYGNANHELTEVAGEVHGLVESWLRRELLDQEDRLT